MVSVVALSPSEVPHTVREVSVYKIVSADCVVGSSFD